MTDFPSERADSRDPGPQPYGDLTDLATERHVLDTVGKDVLADITDDFLGLVDTSAAIYERNGDYAYRIVASAWCRTLDDASRRLCGTPDNREALACGRWHCHEASWATSRASMETGESADMPCTGGLRIYAVPIRAGGRIVGSINVGYGNPPTDSASLEGLAAIYNLDVEKLRRLAESYRGRDPWIIDVAKRRVRVAARLVGRLMERAYRDQRWSVVMEQAREGIVLMRADGHLLDANPRFAQLLGCTVAQARGLHFSDLLHPDEVPARTNDFSHLISDGRLRLRNLETRRRDGTPLMLDVSGAVADIGGVREAVVVLHDVSKRHQREQALEESEARFHRLFKVAPDALLAISEHRVVTLANPAAEELFGCRTGALIGRSIDDLVRAPVDERQTQASEHPVVEPSSIASGLDLRAVREDGSSRPVAIMRSPIAVGDGSATLCIVRDVAEQKQVEAALQDARDRLQQAITAGRVGLWDWDVTTDEVYFSPEWKRQIGYAPEEISNRFNEWERRVHPDDLVTALRTVRATLDGTGSMYESMFRFQHKDGSYRHILAQGTLFRSVEGRPVRIVGSHVDITERVELQMQLVQAQKMESIGRLAGGVAHDFNNLLTAILGFVEFIAGDARLPPALRGDLDEIRRAALSAASLTRQLLAFSRRQVIAPVVLNVNDTLQQVRPMLQRLIGEDVRVVLSLAPRLEAVRLDPGQVEQILMNLGANARDAMPQGGTLTIETKAVVLDDAYMLQHPQGETGEYVMVSVSDTGVGMEKHVLDHIFEPFFTTKGADRGTGLGLATVYGIVKQNNGFVWAYSEPGKGTVFKLYFPALQRSVDAPSARHGDTARGTETILVVEDDARVRAFAERGLTRHGYTALVADSGERALSLATDHDGPIHLVITDVIMPGMDGRAVARELWRVRPGIQVLYCSGYTPDLISQGGVLDEGVAFLEKPYTADQLARRIRELLDSFDNTGDRNGV